MDGRWGPDVVEQWIDIVEAMDKWVGVFFSDPLASDPSSVEVIGASYARIQPAWSRTSAYSLTMTEEAIFRALAPGTNIAAMALMNGAFSNTLIARELVSPVRSFPAGGTFKVDANEWVIGIQVPVVP